MNSQIVGLRVASVLSGLACLSLLAGLLARLQMQRGFYGYMHHGFHGYMYPGFHHAGYFPLLLAIVVTGILSVWFWSLSSTPPKAGPAAGS
jgi:hypothetical protein